MTYARGAASVDDDEQILTQTVNLLAAVDLADLPPDARGRIHSDRAWLAEARRQRGERDGPRIRALITGGQRSPAVLAALVQRPSDPTTRPHPRPYSEQNLPPRCAVCRDVGVAHHPDDPPNMLRQCRHDGSIPFEAEEVAAEIPETGEGLLMDPARRARAANGAN